MFSLLSTLYRVPLQNRWKFLWISHSNSEEFNDRIFFLETFRDFNEV